LVPFPLIALLVFALYLRKSFKSMRAFYSLHEVYGKWLVFFLGRIFTCLLCTPFSPLMGNGKFYNDSFLWMSNFKEN
jgi:hypothetical protein